MNLTALWLIAALVAGIVEILVPLFGFIFVTVAALVAAGASFLGIGWPFQVMIFSVTLILALVLVRPLLTNRFGARGVPTRTEALVGRTGKVVEPIDPVEGKGRVIVGGDDWAARSRLPLAEGTEVVVEGADGIVLIVAPAPRVPAT